MGFRLAIGCQAIFDREHYGRLANEWGPWRDANPLLSTKTSGEEMNAVVGSLERKIEELATKDSTLASALRGDLKKIIEITNENDYERAAGEILRAAERALVCGQYREQAVRASRITRLARQKARAERYLAFIQVRYLENLRVLCNIAKTQKALVEQAFQAKLDSARRAVGSGDSEQMDRWAGYPEFIEEVVRPHFERLSADPSHEVWTAEETERVRRLFVNFRR